MKNIWILVCLLILAAVPAGAKPDAQGGPPPVQLTDRQHADWTAIGRLNTASFSRRGHCTGTLIAPDLVLTAAHCLRSGPADDQTMRDPTKIIFAAGYLKGQAVAHSAGAESWTHPGYDQFKGGFSRFSYDIGLLRLADPIDPALVAPLPVAFTPEPGRPGAVIGYRGDQPHVLTANFRCTLLAVELRLVAMDCPVVSGNSGSPLLSQIDDTWFVVGVVAARANGNQQFRSLAVRLDAPFLALAGKDLQATQAGQ